MKLHLDFLLQINILIIYEYVNRLLLFGNDSEKGDYYDIMVKMYEIYTRGK